MSRFLPHYAPARIARIGQGAIRIRNQPAIVTASQGHYSNPGDTTNRPREELEEVKHDSGKQSGKGKGLGGLHSMDPEKQPDISQAGQAKKEAIQENEEASREFGRDGSAHACHTWKSHEPSIVPPGFGE